MTLGDRILLLRSGKVVQSGTPVELFDHPASPFAARFFGTPGMNLFPAAIVGDGMGTAGIRPERIRLVRAGSGRLRGTVELVEPAGADALVHVATGELSIVVRAVRESLPGAGEEVGLDFSDADVHRFEDVE
jgi:ABC-type sugar transport system ATPase subunit